MDIATYNKIIERIEKQTGVERDRLSQLDYETADELSAVLDNPDYKDDEVKSLVDIACQAGEIFECEKHICSFYSRYYGMVDYDDFNDYKHVPLINNQNDISVYADLTEYKVYTTYKDRVVKLEEYGTPYNMQKAFKNLNYDKMRNVLTEDMKNGGMIVVTPDGKAHETLSDVKFDDNVRIFVDMDGTLARFHDEVKYLERMWEEGFFKELKPFQEIVDSIHILKRDNPDAEIYILSAAIEGEPPYCQQQKHEWLDKYLPEIDREHRIFTEIGKPKADYIEGGISATDILIDDYNRGLEEWEKCGGTAVKCVNNINHKGLVGPLWTGKLIHNDDFPSAIASDICTIARDVARVERRELSKMQDENYHAHYLHAEWVTYMDAYRIYEPSKPNSTIAYVDSNDLEKEEELIKEKGYDGIIMDDADTTIKMRSLVPSDDDERRIYNSNNIEGLKIICFSDGSGRAEYNGDKIGSYDIMSQEMDINNSGGYHVEGSGSEFIDTFQRAVEKYITNSSLNANADENTYEDDYEDEQDNGRK